MKQLNFAKIFILGMIPLIIGGCGGKDSPLFLFPAGGPPSHPAGQGGPDHSPPEPPPNENGDVPETVTTETPVQIVSITPPPPRPVDVPDAPTCAPDSDSAAPLRLVATSPANDADRVATNSRITLIFNKNLNCATAPGIAKRESYMDIPLWEGKGNYIRTGKPVANIEDYFAGEIFKPFPAKVECECNQLMIKPERYLVPSNNYRVRLTSKIQDRSGNPLEQEDHALVSVRDSLLKKTLESFIVAEFRSGPDCITARRRMVNGKLVVPSAEKLRSTPLSLCSISSSPGTGLDRVTPSISLEFNKTLDCGPFASSYPGYFLYRGQYTVTVRKYARGRLDPDHGTFETVAGRAVCNGHTLTYQFDGELPARTIYRFQRIGDVYDRERNFFMPADIKVDSPAAVGHWRYFDDVYHYHTYPPYDPHGDDSPGDSPGDKPADNPDEKPKHDVVDHGPAQKCEGRTIALDTSEGRWFETPPGEIPHHERADKKTRVKGIHTYWANQKLMLRVRDNCKAGWYRLRLRAKNIQGPLPDFYKRFNVLVRRDDQPLGGINLRASDNRYHGGALLVRLPEGDSDFELLWTNDAYKKGEYDANIQIKRVTLKYKRYVRQKRRLVRRAHEYCDVSGRWFWDGKSARTYWKDQTISFCFPDLKAGKYRVVVAAKNYGSLPPDYENFQVVLAANGIAARANIPAHEKKYRRGSAILDLTGGDTRVNLTWLNDKYKPGEYDANIQIRKIKLIRVGDSERSPLAAILMEPGRFKLTWLAAIFAGALMAAFAAGVLKRRFE